MQFAPEFITDRFEFRLVPSNEFVRAEAADGSGPVLHSSERQGALSGLQVALCFLKFHALASAP
ncbi:hypothetical protein DN540_40230 [Burkholderia multivorans]|nr:hypothetical protein DN540_40230 [Burkholderia multivorans]